VVLIMLVVQFMTGYWVGFPYPSSRDPHGFRTV